MTFEQKSLVVFTYIYIICKWNKTYNAPFYYKSGQQNYFKIQWFDRRIIQEGQFYLTQLLNRLLQMCFYILDLIYMYSFNL